MEASHPQVAKIKVSKAFRHSRDGFSIELFEPSGGNGKGVYLMLKHEAERVVEVFPDHAKIVGAKAEAGKPESAHDDEDVAAVLAATVKEAKAIIGRGELAADQLQAIADHEDAAKGTRKEAAKALAKLQD